MSVRPLKLKKGGISSAPAKARPIEVINEPLPTWEPLWKAPFYWGDDGFCASSDEWVKDTAPKIKKRIEFLALTKMGQDADILAFDGKWSMRRICSPGWGVIFDTMGVTTILRPGMVQILIPKDTIRKDTLTKDQLPDWQVSGRSMDQLRRDTDWDRVPSGFEKGAFFHQRILDGLFGRWVWNLRRALENGQAKMMARKSNVLAPFEQVTCDQWQFFQLRTREKASDLTPPLEKYPWYDPRRPAWDYERFDTAIGPNGEVLYSIHIAPNPNQVRKLPAGPEEKCQQWLGELMRDYPARPPMKLDLLATEAHSKFPGLSKRRFFQCLMLVQADTKNRNWSRSGAPKKSPQ